MAGASATLGAVGISHAETVQITLSNLFVFNDSGDPNAVLISTQSDDLTGDGVGDVDFLLPLIGEAASEGLVAVIAEFSDPVVAGTLAYKRNIGIASYEASISRYRVRIGNPYYPGSSIDTTSLTPLDISALLKITFTDARINGGQETEAFLQVRAFNTSKTRHRVELVRLIFDNASPALPTATANDPAYPEAFPSADTAQLRSSLNKKIKREQKKLRKAKKSGNKKQIKKVKKKIRALKKQLRAL